MLPRQLFSNSLTNRPRSCKQHSTVSPLFQVDQRNMPSQKQTPASSSDDGNNNGSQEDNWGENSGRVDNDLGVDAYPDRARAPFFAFVPEVGKWAGGIALGEAQIVKNFTLNCLPWTKDFLSETFVFYNQNKRILFNEVLSGFTVAIMQVPESIAFSFVAGVPPLSGLQATFWMALITGIFGGKPGMISGAAGALAVVVADLTAEDGPLANLTMPERLNVLYMTMFVCGIMQIGFAVLRLAKLVKLIPETGLIGFMNGLAIIIFMAQLPAFQFCDEEPLFIECTLEQRQWLNFKDHTAELVLVIVHVVICMLIMKFFPKTPKVGKVIPASLVGLIVGLLIERFVFRAGFGVSTRTVDETSPISGSVPKFDWPAIPNDGNTIRTMFGFAITLATIGAVESVLTLQACNEITKTVPEISDSNQECFAQGLANLVCGLFRAMGGDAMIGQSTINIMNGARHRVSSTMSGIFMLLFIVAFSSFIGLLPIGTLTGVLFMVVLSTFQWKTFIILRYGRLSDSIAILLVTLIAVFFNLAIAIGIGIVFSALIHAWDSGAHVESDISYKRMTVNGEVIEKVKYVRVKGAIFFSSTNKLISMFNVADDPSVIVIDLKDALVIDHSAVSAIEGITKRFALADKRVLLVNMPIKAHGRLHRTADHEVLKSQIVTPGSQALYEMAPDNEKTSLGELDMFQKPIETPEEEMEKLQKKQGDVNIADVSA